MTATRACNLAFFFLLFAISQLLPAQSRDRRLMDRNWKFRLADSSLPGEAGTSIGGWKWKAIEGLTPTEVPMPDKSWKDVSPGTDIFVGRVGFAWYTASLPHSPAKSGNVLTFDGVDDNCTVFLNGKKIGSHEGWAESFDMPLDSAWNSNGENTLLVLVENTAGIGGIKGASLRTDTAAVASPDFDDHAWRTVDVPHDFVVERPIDPAAGDANFGFRPGGVAWYRRHFTVDPSRKGRRVWLEFDGIYRNSKIYLNGTLLHAHPSGYTSFYIDITDAVRLGEENVLAVRVDASAHEGWWYEGGGIYRHVYLTTLNPVHIAHWGVYLSANVLGKLPSPTGRSNVLLNAVVSVQNETDKNQRIGVGYEIFDADGKSIFGHVSGRSIKPYSIANDPTNQIVSDLDLWSVDRPYLYKVVLTVSVDGEEVDRMEIPFGIRHIHFDANKGFFLNGSPLKIQGTCNHQDFAGVGIALPDRLHEYKIEKLKEMGCNAYRCSHHPPAPEILDACDRLGMLVMDENRHLGESPLILDEAKSMVLRDRNHPSVILWSICNEESLQGTEEGRRKAQAIKDVINQYDGTRLVTAAMQASWGQGVSHVIDVQGFNYFPEQYDPFHKSHPNQPMIGTEIGSILTTRGEYKQDDIRGFVSSYNDGAQRIWTAVADRPYMAGGFLWTGFDYRGEPTPFGWPNVNSHFGIMDTCGFPKDDYFYYQAAWTNKLVLHLFPHWNFAYPKRPEPEQGAEVEVRCYTNCDKVELFVNGKSQGQKPATPNRRLSWKVKWNPGELSAKGWKDGKEITTKIETAGLPAAIQLSADRTEPRADGEDVVLLSATIVDAQGRHCPTADNDVAFSVSDGAKVIGVGNGNPASAEADRASSRRAFNGKCLAIVAVGEKSGTVTVSATSPSLRTGTAELHVQPAHARPSIP